MIVNRANIPGARVWGKEIKGEMGFIDDLVDLEEDYDVVNGMSSPNARRDSAQPVLAGRPETQLAYGRKTGCGGSRWE